jgi:hypothetical protein
MPVAPSREAQIGRRHLSTGNRQLADRPLGPWSAAAEGRGQRAQGEEPRHLREDVELHDLLAGHVVEGAVAPGELREVTDDNLARRPALRPDRPGTIRCGLRR